MDRSLFQDIYTHTENVGTQTSFFAALIHIDAISTITLVK